MSGIKTGNKGFVNPVDGKVYTVDPVLDGDKGTNLLPPSYDPGDMTVDNSVKDISKKTRLTLGTYLSKATKGEIPSYTNIPNKYAIDPSTEASLTSPLLDEKGYPVPPTASENSQKFAGNLPSSFSQNYASLNQNDQKIKKGLSSVNVPDGHTLLSDAANANSPVSSYQTFAFTPNYRTSFVSFADFKTPPKKLDVSLINLPNEYFKKPNEEAVVPNLLTLNLNAAVQKVATLTAGTDLESPGPKNAYPVSIPDQLNLDNLASLSDANGLPTPLSNADNQNVDVFKANLRSSISDDYAEIAGNYPKFALTKGKAVSGEESLDGNQLLQSAKNSEFLDKYNDRIFQKNYRTSFVSFVDFKTPPKTLDISLVNLPNEFFKKPDEEAVVPGLLTLDLKTAVQKAATLTGGTDQESPGLKNKYSVSVPVPENFKLTDLFSITTTEGYPSPLTIADSNEKFDGNLPSSFSENFAVLNQDSKKINKGLSSDSAPDGHTLLPTAAEKAPAGGAYIKNANLLNDPISTYTKEVVTDNSFNPYNFSFLPPEIDAISPPKEFQPSINVGETLGNYSDEGASKSKWNLEQLRSKASEITQENKYSVDPPIEGQILISTNDSVTSRPSPLSNGNVDSYAPREAIRPLSRDPSIKNFSKGKESQELNDGNTLLRLGIPGSNSPEDPGITQLNPLYDYVGGRGSSILNVGNNRFAASSRPEAGFNPALKLADGRAVSHLKMAQVGTGLLQRAAAEIPAWTADKFNPNGPEAALGSIIPSVAQLGILKVDNILLEARDVLESLTGVSQSGEIDDESDALAAGSLMSISPIDGQSWGTFTTPDEMFDSPGSIGFNITFFLLMITIILAVSAFSNVDNTPVKTRNEKGQLALGKFQFSEAGLGVFNLENTMGIRRTNNTFTKCVGVGIRSFFLGASNAEVSAGQLVAAAAGIGADSLIGEGSAVGANLVIMRTILRSGFVIAQFIDRISKAASQNPAAALSAATGIQSIFRSSKLIAAINVFAQLGDALIDRQQKQVLDAEGKPLNTPSYGMDSQDPNSSHSTVTKNRLSFYDSDPATKKTSFNYSSQLAWALKRAPSRYLIPANIAGLQKRSNLTPGAPLNAFAGALALSQPIKDDKFSSNKTLNSVTTGRIDGKLREDLENILDAEYVPFYFHDIRTNEIVSFHAFLSSLSDDYSVSYESVEGFGRVEPVKIYKGTQRKIGLSFTVAATSQDDFHHMWFKINKLITLAYPQYTAGRDLVGSNYQFKAPFSQMIGASPLIRIRLGDILRSNYSRFALARLFGATDGDMEIPKTNSEGTTIKLESKVLTNAEEKEIKQKRNKLKDQLYYIKPGSDDDNGITDQFLNKTVTINANSYPNDKDRPNILPFNARTEKITATNSGFNGRLGEAKIIGKETGGYYTVEVDLYKGQDIDPTAEAFFTEAPPAVKIASVTFPVYKTALNLTEQSLNELVGLDPTATGPQQAHDELASFMDPQTNIIVKSFESAGGKGLAGVIESINFDWYNQATWEVLPGHTAPKMCKVTISFAPIHDITPGIDHMGYNRAPIYPVGNAMNDNKVT